MPCFSVQKANLLLPAIKKVTFRIPFVDLDMLPVPLIPLENTEYYGGNSNYITLEDCWSQIQPDNYLIMSREQIVRFYTTKPYILKLDKLMQSMDVLTYVDDFSVQSFAKLWQNFCSSLKTMPNTKRWNSLELEFEHEIDHNGNFWRMGNTISFPWTRCL